MPIVPLATILFLVSSSPPAPQGAVDRVDLRPLVLPMDDVPSLRAALHRLTQRQPEWLGLGSADGLRDIRFLALRKGAIVRARRVYRGVPVIDQSIALRLAEDGAVLRRRSDFTPLELDAPVVLSPEEAMGRAVRATYGAPRGDVNPSALPTRLVVVPDRPAWAYAVHVSGWFPTQRRTVLVDATTGDILGVRRSVRRAASSAAVYQPSPDPEETLADPVIVELERLSEEEPQVTVGEHVDSRSCLYDVGQARAMTCLDIAGGIACDFAAELRDLVLPLCGEGYAAESRGDDGLVYEPADDVSDYAGDAVFTDPFPEVHAYYHVDRVAEFFRALGHPVSASGPMSIVVNLTLPSMSLIRCASEAWASQQQPRSSEDALDAVRSCSHLDAPFSPFDNAFYTGGELERMVGISGGLYFGQGSAADFAYDGSVIYHEYAHAIEGEVGALGVNEVTDEYGIDASPGALAEAFADYFAGALTENPELGRYVGGRLGQAGALRTMEHTMACPQYVQGEVHQDSIGFSAALWQARKAYPQTEKDPRTGREIRVFDRVVYEALAMLGSGATQADAARQVVATAAAETALQDPEGDIADCIMRARNVLRCERVRSLCNEPIDRLFMPAAASDGGGGAIDMFMGGGFYAPYAPGPVQLRVDATAGEDLVAFEATLGEMGAFMEDMPDIFGGSDDDGVAPVDLRLKYRADQPVAFRFSQSRSGTAVTAMAEDGEVPLTVSRGAQTIVTGSLPLPNDAERVYFALVNYGPQPIVLESIRLTTPGMDCPFERSAADARCTGGVDAGEKAGGPAMLGEQSGCTCAAASGHAFPLAVLAGLWCLRRRSGRRSR